MLFKHLISDFVVVEKTGDHLCGSIPPETLKPFVSEEIEPRGVPAFLTEDDLKGLKELADKKSGTYFVKLQAENNTKEDRKHFHVFLREEYDNSLYSRSKDDGIEVSIGAKGKSDRSAFWPRQVGPFMHFTIKKEDHETIHALNRIAKLIRLKDASSFRFCGTKDRRAVTYQRVSVFKLLPTRITDRVMEILNREKIEIIEISFEKEALRLGGHESNLFHILLRDATIDEDRFNVVKTVGCWNKYGPQRFGSVNGITATVGKLILQNKFTEAVNMLLDPERATGRLKKVLEQYAVTKNESAIRGIPFYMTSFIEIVIIRSLTKSTKEDENEKAKDAIVKIPLNMRSLYVHAYQSKLFNEFVDIYKEKHTIEESVGKEVAIPMHSLDENDGELYQIYSELLAKDDLTLQSFKPIASSFHIYASNRKVVLEVENLSYELIQHEKLDEPITLYPNFDAQQDRGTGYQSVVLHFSLGPGSYATTVLSGIFDQEFKSGICVES